MSDEKIFPNEFVPNIQSFTKLSYTSWKNANPKEAVAWEKFRDTIITGKPATPPTMATRFGKALVAAGKLHMSVIDLGSAPVQPPPGSSGFPPVIPNQPATFQGPLDITAGGTYSGNWQSLTPSPAIYIHYPLTAPVLIQNSHIKGLSADRITRTDWPHAVDLTFRNCVFWGGVGRVIETEGHKSLTFENCTFVNTSGIRINTPGAGSTTLLTKNRHINTQHWPLGFGNFVQFNGGNLNNGIVEWNEIWSEHDASDSEDLVSMIGISNLIVRDNYFEHQSLPSAGGSPSKGGLTIEQGCTNIQCLRNQLVDTVGGLAIFASSNCVMHYNRVISDGFMGDTGIASTLGFEPVWIDPNTTNCHMHGNTLGYSGTSGYQYGRYLGAPEGDLAERALNTYVGPPVTRAMELTERTVWTDKLAASSIVVGASL